MVERVYPGLSGESYFDETLKGEVRGNHKALKGEVQFPLGDKTLKGEVRGKGGVRRWGVSIDKVVSDWLSKIAVKMGWIGCYLLYPLGFVLMWVFFAPFFGAAFVDEEAGGRGNIYISGVVFVICAYMWYPMMWNIGSDIVRQAVLRF